MDTMLKEPGMMGSGLAFCLNEFCLKARKRSDRYLLVLGLLFSHLLCDLAASMRTRPALSFMTGLSNSLYFIPASQLCLTRALMESDKARQRMCNGAHFWLIAPGERWQGGRGGAEPDGAEV